MSATEERLFGLIDSLRDCTDLLSRPEELEKEALQAAFLTWREGFENLRSTLDGYTPEPGTAPRERLIEKLTELRSVTQHTIKTVKGINDETGEQLNTLWQTRRAVNAYRR